MGRVKLNFLPMYFLHGTPFYQSLGGAASHGCVRMNNNDAIELARLVHRFTTPAISPFNLDSIVARPDSTTLIQLPALVPVTIRYDLAELRDDTLHVYPNVYRLALGSLRAQVLKALRAHGYDTEAVDAAVLGRTIRQAQRRHVAVPLDALLRRNATTP